MEAELNNTLLKKQKMEQISKYLPIQCQYHQEEYFKLTHLCLSIKCPKYLVPVCSQCMIDDHDHSLNFFYKLTDYFSIFEQKLIEANFNENTVVVNEIKMNWQTLEVFQKLCKEIKIVENDLHQLYSQTEHIGAELSSEYNSEFYMQKLLLILKAIYSTKKNQDSDLLKNSIIEMQKFIILQEEFFDQSKNLKPELQDSQIIKQKKVKDLMQGLSNEELYEQYQKYLIQKLQMLKEQIKKIETFDQWRPQIFKKFQRIDLPETEAMVCDYEQNIYSLGQAEGSPGKRYLVSQSSFSFGVHKFIVEFLNVDELLRSCDCGIGIMTEQDYLNKIDVWCTGLVPFKCLFDNCAKNMAGVPNFSQYLNGEQNKIKVVLDMDNFKFTISTLDDSMISQNTSSYSLENKTFRFFINFYQTSANPQIKICNTF